MASYEKDPRNISLSMPHEEEIYARLELDFSFAKVDRYLNSRRNYLNKIVTYAKEEFQEINEEKIRYVKRKKN